MHEAIVSSQRLSRVARVLWYFFLVVAMPVSAQTVTLDFTPTNFVLGASLPWIEDEFTVASLTGLNPPFVQMSHTVSLTPLWTLNFHGDRTETSAIVANNSMLTFDLLSLDVVSLRLGLIGLGPVTNFARVISSAGGSYDLLGTPDGTTLLFGGSQWENLSYLKVEFQSQSGIFTGPFLGALQLDNFVLRPVAVPEPSGLWSCVLVVVGVVGCKRNTFPQREISQ